MANTKEYKIVINGITESVKAVESLNKELSTLESRIKALEGKSVGVKASGGGSTTSSKGSLSEEEKIAKQIEQIDAKRVAYSKEIYQNYLAAKDVLKETVKDQNAIAASERLQAKSYSNTIMGMKQELADIKSAMQTVDLGDTDQLDKMVKRANELNESLKKIEESYGQFGRNVGNYQSAFDGIGKVAIDVNGVTREFNSAREASRTLNEELKAMAINGKSNTKEFKGLQQVVMELESTIKDVKSPLDNMMDAMESITAIANVGQGIRGLFGVDDAEMQKSIKNLVALQNVLKGIETINKQMKTGEGIGGWLKPFNTQIDGAIAKLTALQTSMNATTVSAKAMAIGIKTATLALKAFKAALSFGVTIAIDLVLEKVLDLIEKFKEGDKELQKQKKYIEETQGAYAKAAAEIGVYTNKVNNFNGTQKQENKLVEELNKKFGEQLGTYKTLAEWKKVLQERGEAYAKTMLKEAEAQALLNMYTEAFINLQKVQAGVATGEYHHWYQTVAGDREADAKAIAEANKKLTEAEDAYRKKMEEIDNFNKNNKLGDDSPQIEKNGKKNTNAVEKAENELAKARIAAMKEGLNKTILQLEEERKERLAKLNRNAKDYKQQEAQWNKYYNDRILEESEKWARKMNKVYSDLYSNIASYAANNLKMVAQETSEELERALRGLDDKMSNISNKMAGYSPFAGMKMSPQTQFNLGIISFNKSKEVEMVKELINLEREATIETARLSSDEAEYMEKYRKFKQEEKKLDEETKKSKLQDLQEEEKYFQMREAHLKEQLEHIDLYKRAMRSSWQDGSYDDETFMNEFTSIKSALLDEGYLNELSDVFKTRLAVQKTYWNDVMNITKEGAEREKKARLDVLFKEQEEEDAANLAWRDKSLQEARNYYRELEEGYKTQYEHNLMDADEYETKTTELKKQAEDTRSKIIEEYKKRINNITKKYETERQNIIKDSGDKVNKVTIDELNQRMTEVRDFQTQISNLEQKQPVINAWGMTNWSETKKNNQQIKDSYIELAAELSNVRKKAMEVLGDKNASKEFKDQAEGVLREARNMTAGIGQTLDELEYKMSNWAKAQTFFQDIQMYFQEVMNSVQTILSAVWDAQDAQFEKEQELLDKMNEELDKKLDEQQEIVQKHKDAVDSIEDELANARGERRQHLIDQINAEMAAQRAAQKQEQKIAKEKEAAQKKQDDLDKKRKKAEYQRNMLQAIVNGALAVTMAAVNAWPMPAIAMMALAGAATAAQIAIMASNKPFRTGGQLEGGLVRGKRHTQGGVPVGNTGIEVEGDEMIIRRESTMPNIDLLNYINKSQRKLNLDDFIEFYSSGKIKKNIISMSPKTKFADGGVIPTIQNNYSFDDRLISAFEEYSNRAVYVSVVDILNKQDNVKAVQTLAGLAE